MKIKNAKTTLGNNGIIFKSQLESRIDKFLSSFISEPNYYTYESEKISLLPKTTLKFKAYQKEKRIKTLREITYTPDFVIVTKTAKIYIEAKGFANDVYPVKKKLFLEKLNSSPDKVYFLEVYSVAQLKNLLNIINNEDKIF